MSSSFDSPKINFNKSKSFTIEALLIEMLENAQKRHKTLSSDEQMHFEKYLDALKGMLFAYTSLTSFTISPFTLMSRAAEADKIISFYNGDNQDIDKLLASIKKESPTITEILNRLDKAIEKSKTIENSAAQLDLLLRLKTEISKNNNVQKYIQDYLKKMPNLLQQLFSLDDGISAITLTPPLPILQNKADLAFASLYLDYLKALYEALNTGKTLDLGLGFVLGYVAKQFANNENIASFIKPWIKQLEVRIELYTKLNPQETKEFKDKKDNEQSIQAQSKNDIKQKLEDASRALSSTKTSTASEPTPASAPLSFITNTAPESSSSAKISKPTPIPLTDSDTKSKQDKP